MTGADLGVKAQITKLLAFLYTINNIALLCVDDFTEDAYPLLPLVWQHAVFDFH